MRNVQYSAHVGSGPCAWTNAKYPDSWYRSPKSATRNLASKQAFEKRGSPSIEVHSRSNKGRGTGHQASKQASKQGSRRNAAGARERRGLPFHGRRNRRVDGSQAESPTAMCVLICTESGATVEQPHRHGCSDEQELVMSEKINITALLPQTE